MRILHVLPLFSLELGDIWHGLRSSVRHMAARGHEVWLVGADGPDTQTLEREFSCQYLAFESKKTDRDLYFTPHMIDWARHNVESFDLIHLHGVRSFQNNLFRHYARQNRIPYVLTPHGSLDQTRLNTWRVVSPEKQVHLQSLAQASLILPASNLEQQELFEAGIPNERMRLIPPGIEIAPANLEAISNYRLVRRWNGSRLAGVYLGRSEPKAGIHHLLRAYQRLRSRLPELQLLIQIQQVDEIEDWQRRAQLLEVEHGVTFCGPLPQEERALALSAADIVVATDRNPGVELAPLEALLCGTPVVASKASGVGELLQPCNGAFFFPASDVEVLAVGLLQALTDERGTKERLEHGREFVKTHFNWNDITDRLEGVYEEARQFHRTPATIELVEPVES